MRFYKHSISSLFIGNGNNKKIDIAQKNSKKYKPSVNSTLWKGYANFIDIVSVVLASIGLPVLF